MHVVRVNKLPVQNSLLGFSKSSIYKIDVIKHNCSTMSFEPGETISIVRDKLTDAVAELIVFVVILIYNIVHS